MKNWHRSMTMKMLEIRDLALTRGLKPGNLKKRDLIRWIQREEGNFDCYATAQDGYCDQWKCLWRSDCFQDAKRLND
jgi:hypothetical protein